MAGAVATLAFAVISVLFTKYFQTSQDLQAEKADLEQANETLDAQATELAQLAESERQAAERERQAAERERRAAERAERRADEVLRLSALQDYDELIARVDELSPAHPENIAAYEAWLREARALVAELPLHRAKLDELRAGALPREAEQRAHPDFARLEALPSLIDSRRTTLAQRRDGVEAATFEPEWSALPEDASTLNEMAGPLVKVDREVFGREAEGLALAQRALALAEQAEDDALVATVGDTLSRALFALGRDGEALKASAMALEVAPKERREEFAGYLTELEDWVEAAASAEALAQAKDELAALEAERAELAARVNERRTWTFPDTDAGREARWWHVNLTKLIESLEGLRDPRTGLLSEAEQAVSAEHGWSVPRRLRLAERLRNGLAEGGEWAGRWAEAAAAIASHPAYGGLELEPQVGLVPIGPDPASGLWEFWHVATGEEPERDADRKIVVTEEMGVVLVLIPAGTFWMGASADPDAEHNHDPQAQNEESPVHLVTLSAYFLSKYELTQGQWQRLTGWNRSTYGPQGQWSNDWTRAGVAGTWTSPVTNVSWFDCMDWLPRVGLRLPSEAQWENGCRAGTGSVWWPGSNPELLEGVANVKDAFAHQHTASAWTGHEMALDDGATVHAPIGTYAANPFGLHEVHGNVWEWCLDGYVSDFYGRGAKVDPEAPWEGAARRVNRGGGFDGPARLARSALRFYSPPTHAGIYLGVRPARVITD